MNNCYFPFLILILWCLPRPLTAQISRAVDPITCYSHQFVEIANVPISADILDGSSVRASEFIFQFTENVPTNVQEVVRFAGMIWETKLITNIPIQVAIDWQADEEDNVLASAGPSTIYRDFSGAINPSVWYPAALAEAIAQTNFNEASSDIRLNINSVPPWYFGLDGKPPRGQIDMVSVILHELGHGLGFFSSAEVEGDTIGMIGYDQLSMIFDIYIVNADNVSLEDDRIFLNPSAALLAELTGNQLFFASDLAAEFFRDRFPPLYAPSPFKPGSSISHLDESTFPPGSPDALMTPFIAFGESTHDPGNITLAIMAEMGWSTELQATPVRDARAGMVVRLYPNPAGDYVMLDLPEVVNRRGMDIQIFDLAGRLRLETTAAEQANKHNGIVIDNLENGTYVVRLSAGGLRIATSTLVVHR